MQSEIFYSQTIEIKNPFKPYGVAKIVVSILAFIFSLPVLFKFRESIPLFLQDMHANELHFILAILSGFIALIWIIWGVKNLVVGIKNLGHLVVPPRTPPDFKDYKEAEHALVRKEMPIYRMPSSGPLYVARKYLSDKIPFLTEQPRRVVEMNIAFVRRLIIFLFLVSFVVFGKSFIPLQVLEEIRLISQLLTPPIVFLLVLFVVGALKVWSIFSLLPSYLPRTDVLETIVSVKGAGDPFQLPAAIEESFLTIRTQGMPNRTFRAGFNEEVGGVENTGRFQGKIFLETQPTHISHPTPSIVNLYLLGGVSLLAAAMYLLTHLSLQIAHNPEEQIWQVADMGWDIIKGLVFASIGGGFLRQAHFLLGTFRYESLLTFLTIEGSYGRSEIKAGKSMTDSFETSNVVVRSDCHARVYVSKILSENYTLEGDRHIIGMVAAPEAEHAQDLVRNTFSAFEKRGVSIRGIDVTSETVQEIAKANIAYQHRINIVSSSSEEPPLTLSERPTPKHIGNHYSKKEPTHGDDDTKLCPDCAEYVKAKARKCRFCGYEFKE